MFFLKNKPLVKLSIEVISATLNLSRGEKGGGKGRGKREGEKGGGKGRGKREGENKIMKILRFC